MNTDVSAPLVAPAATDYPDDVIGLGVLVQAAYDMAYNGHKKGDGRDLNPPIPQGFPSNYKIISSVVMKDDGVPSFYGFLARQTDAENSFVLIIRGTIDIPEWISDFESIIPVPFYKAGKVGKGFAAIYNTIYLKPYAYPSQPQTFAADGDAEKRPFAKQVADALTVHAAMGERADAALPTPRLSVAGHSLGSALITLYVVERLVSKPIPIDAFCTFASPHVGDAAFASAFDDLKIPKTYRVYNDYDIVPDLPPSWLVTFVPVGTPKELFLNTSYWCADPACSHPLSTYLNCLDPSRFAPAPACTDLLATALVGDIDGAPATPTPSIGHGPAAVVGEAETTHP